MEKAFFVLKSFKLWHVINLLGIRFTNNVVLHSNFIPISRIAWNYFLLLTNSEKRTFHSISFDSIRSDVTSQFRFLSFFFYRFIAFNVCKLVRGLFPLRSSLCLKTKHPRKSLDSCPLSFLFNDHVRKKRRQGNEEREITEGTTEKWKKEMVGGKIPGKIGELGRGQQLPSAHYFRLSLVHVTYCFRSRAWGRKRKKNGQRQSIS